MHCETAALYYDKNHTKSPLLRCLGAQDQRIPGFLDYASKATVSRKITDKYPSEMFHEFKSKPLTESYFQ